MVNLNIIDVKFKKSLGEKSLFKWMLSFLTSPDISLNKQSSLFV